MSGFVLIVTIATDNYDKAEVYLRDCSVLQQSGAMLLQLPYDHNDCSTFTVAKIYLQ